MDKRQALLQTKTLRKPPGGRHRPHLQRWRNTVQRVCLMKSQSQPAHSSQYTFFSPCKRIFKAIMISAGLLSWWASLSLLYGIRCYLLAGRLIRRERARESSDNQKKYTEHKAPAGMELWLISLTTLSNSFLSRSTTESSQRRGNVWSNDKLIWKCSTAACALIAPATCRHPFVRCFQCCCSTPY